MTLCARCMIDGSAALLRAVRRARGLQESRPAARVTVTGLIAHAEAVFGVPAAAILGHGRKRGVVRPRQAVAWVARQATPRSWPEIGRALGGRDHSTMIHAAERVEAYAQREPEFAWLVERLWAAGECEPWGPRAKGPIGPDAGETPDVPAETPEADPYAAPPSLWRRVSRISPDEYAPRHALTLTPAMIEMIGSACAERDAA